MKPTRVRWPASWPAFVSLAVLAAGCGSGSTASGRGGAAGTAAGGHAAGATGTATGGRGGAGASGIAGVAGASSGGGGGGGGAGGVLGSAGGPGGGGGTRGAAGAGAGGAAGAAGAGGAAGGAAATTYVGCRFIGGIDRYVVAKRDAAQNRCFGLVLDAPGSSPVSFLTLPAGIGLAGISIGPAASCPSRAVSPNGPATVGGTVTQVTGERGAPTVLDVHVTVNFSTDAGAPASEELIAAGVDVTPACP